MRAGFRKRQVERHERARNRGEKDALAGKAREACPFTLYELRKCWENGFDTVARQAPLLATTAQEAKT